jgi:hypothetical protein
MDIEHGTFQKPGFARKGREHGENHMTGVHRIFRIKVVEQ